MRTLTLAAMIAASCLLPFAPPAHANPATPGSPIDFVAIPSPIIFKGDATTAYRDPFILRNNGTFYLYFSEVNIGPGKQPFMVTAWSKSTDLIHWTPPKPFTPRDQNLNFGSPGNIVRFGNQWVLCLQTYPRPNCEKFGNKDSRIWIMRGGDLETWGPPELLKVLGPSVPREKMGRMIDPFLLQDKDDAAKWWCLFKVNGAVTLSWSRDLQNWTYTGQKIAGGENPCVIVDGSDYILYYAPANGIGVKRSPDLKHWTAEPTLTLDQKDWPWAQGRLTAGYVLDLRNDPRVGKAIMVFHGSAYREGDPRGGFDNFASIGLAWSDDLKAWHWPAYKSLGTNH